MPDSFVTPQTVAHRAPLPMGFPREEYWSGLPFPSVGDLPDPGSFRTMHLDSCSEILMDTNVDIIVHQQKYD